MPNQLSNELESSPGPPSGPARGTRAGQCPRCQWLARRAGLLLAVRFAYLSHANCHGELKGDFLSLSLSLSTV